MKCGNWEWSPSVHFLFRHIHSKSLSLQPVFEDLDTSLLSTQRVFGAAMAKKKGINSMICIWMD